MRRPDWRDQICQQFDTLSINILNVWTSTPMMEYPPSFGEYVAELLDGKIEINSAGTGRPIFQGSLMELALIRLREAGWPEKEENGNVEKSKNPGE